MKIAVITCYKDPNYVRAKALRAGLAQCNNVELNIIKNKHRGISRYFEVLYKIMKTKLREKPDCYLLTFRGYEILPFLLLIAGKKPVIFDELINLTERMVDEHETIRPDSLGAKWLNWWYGRQLQRCRFIIADTQAHAEYSAKRSNISLDKYRVIPVSTDETTFKPRQRVNHKKEFTVFYYGSMLPLHGLPIVTQAAELLKSEKDINFLIVGGGKEAENICKMSSKRGAHVVYKNWVDYSRLPELISNSGLCLAGPFGNTLQGQMVITGKAFQFLASAAPTLIGTNKASSIFKDKKDSLIIPQGDSNALAQAIKWAFNHKLDLEIIAQNGRLTYEKFFSNKIVAQKLEQIIRLLD